MLSILRIEIAVIEPAQTADLLIMKKIVIAIYLEFLLGFISFTYKKFIFDTVKLKTQTFTDFRVLKIYYVHGNEEYWQQSQDNCIFDPLDCR
jgi:hypothetical protein